MKYLSIVILIFTSCFLFGQNLTITKGEKTKHFSENNYFQFSLSKIDKKLSPCTYVSITGYVTMESQDSIQIDLLDFQQTKCLYYTPNIEFVHPTKSTNEIKFAKQDVEYFTVFKSEKKYRRKENLLVAGATLLLTGVGTATSYFLFKKSEKRNKLLLSGGIQLGLGISFLWIANSRKTYNFRQEKPRWQF